jgi:NitT/TauT family transport system substrate-binding protein
MLRMFTDGSTETERSAESAGHRRVGRVVRGAAVRAALGVTTLVAVACGSAAASNAAATSQPDPAVVRLGYLTNLTHAPALIGVSKGYFQSMLPSSTTLQTNTFSAGPAESEALLGGSLDAAFVGPNPAVTAFLSTKGKGIRVVAGAAAGGAGLVVSPQIAAGTFPADLKGQTLASPQLGNTQDVALRTWLGKNGLTSNSTGGSADVTVDSSSGNSLDLQRFVGHQIAGGWEPEPYESEYILNGHGKLVVDEASLWPNNEFPTTELVVSTSLLTNHPDIVTDLVKGLVKSVDWINQNPAAAQAATNSALSAITGGKLLSAAVLQLAWTHLKFTVDPLADDLKVDAAHAQQLGVISGSSLIGIIDVKPLNSVLSAAGKSAVLDGGLGS